MATQDSDTALTLAAEAWTCPEDVPMRQRRDWRLLYERERARAEAAEARAQELRWAEVAARCDAGSWKSRFEASRRKLKAAVKQAKNALSLQGEVARLHQLLREAGVESSARSTMTPLRMEVARLRRTVRSSEARRHEMRQLHRALLRRSRRQKTTINELSRENARLRRIAKASRNRLETLEA